MVQVGDTVEHKADRTRMTVEKVGLHPGTGVPTVWCTWIAQTDGTQRRGSFPLAGVLAVQMEGDAAS
jgi:hypothetical protein